MVGCVIARGGPPRKWFPPHSHYTRPLYRWWSAAPRITHSSDRGRHVTGGLSSLHFELQRMYETWQWHDFKAIPAQYGGILSISHHYSWSAQLPQAFQTRVQVEAGDMVWSTFPQRLRKIPDALSCIHDETLGQAALQLYMAVASPASQSHLKRDLLCIRPRGRLICWLQA